MPPTYLWVHQLHLTHLNSAAGPHLAPVGELVLHLDDIVGDGAAAVALRLGPLQLHHRVVVVVNHGLAGLARLTCSELASLVIWINIHTG